MTQSVVFDIAKLVEHKRRNGTADKHSEHVACITLDAHGARLLMAAIADKREVVQPYDYRALDAVLSALKQAVRP